MKFLLLTLLVALAACTPQVVQQVLDSSDQKGELIAGKFLDSAVHGLEYESSDDQGVTGVSGEFVCKKGEVITFKLRNIILGNAICDSTITPVELAVPGKTYGNYGTLSNFEVNKVAKLLVFLQTLDSDGNPENGIHITPKIKILLEEKVREVTRMATGEIALNYHDSNLGIDAENTLASVVEQVNTDMTVSEYLRQPAEQEANHHFVNITLDKINHDDDDQGEDEDDGDDHESTPVVPEPIVEDPIVPEPIAEEPVVVEPVVACAAYNFSEEAKLYHVLTADNRCVWSCGVGTTPNFANQECVCQNGLVETVRDQFGRRVCEAPVEEVVELPPALDPICLNPKPYEPSPSSGVLPLTGYCKAFINSEIYYNGQTLVTKAQCDSSCLGLYNAKNTASMGGTVYTGKYLSCFFDSTRYLPAYNRIFLKELSGGNVNPVLKEVNETGSLLAQTSTGYSMYLGGGNIYVNVKAGQSFTTIDSGYLDYVEVGLISSATMITQFAPVYMELTDSNWNVIEKTQIQGFVGDKIVRFNFSKTNFLEANKEYRIKVYLEDTTDHYAIKAFQNVYCAGAMYDARQSQGNIFNKKTWDMMFRVKLSK